MAETLPLIGKGHCHIHCFAANLAALTLSALSFPAGLPRIFFCCLFQIPPERGLLKKGLFAQSLPHPRFTSFPGRESCSRTGQQIVCPYFNHNRLDYFVNEILIDIQDRLIKRLRGGLSRPLAFTAGVVKRYCAFHFFNGLFRCPRLYDKTRHFLTGSRPLAVGILIHGKLFHTALLYLRYIFSVNIYNMCEHSL